jgi:carboxypeptidase C (cathepsin A)
VRPRGLRPLLAIALALALALAACGGGGNSAPAVAAPAVPAATLQDPTPYSSAAGGSLAASSEAASVTAHTLVVGTTTLAYTATAGHLDARHPQSGATEASLFYVAYTLDGAAPASRPLVFFYNGGPGSATVWLHLGSFAPRRIVTDAPSLALPLPFQLVDNQESLIDVADLVFVDAVGSGYSTAVAPYTNQSFWGVDADAALMRDFIARFVAVRQRDVSPIFLFGESYGTTRSAVLADLMLAAGMRLDGMILQSSVLDYNSNCDVFAPGEVSCEGFLPSYGETGAWHGLSSPLPADAGAFANVLRSFATDVYGPAVAAFVASGQTAPAGLVDQLTALTGAPAALWNANLDLDPRSYRSLVLPGRLMGRYDARIVAGDGSALAASGDPSSALITAPFAAAAQQLFRQELLYSASAAYTLLSGAISRWNFSHDGEALPDTIPDLAAALARHPGLRVLSLAGYHDLATPFLQTELDLERLGPQPNVFIRAYPGGHMTYLDDASRARLRDDVRAFLQGAPMAAQAATPRLRAAVAAASAPAVGTAAVPAPAVDRERLAQGGDPYVPPAQRVRRATVAPRGAELETAVRAKLAARDRDVYR